MRPNVYPTTDTDWLSEVKARGVADVADAFDLKRGKPVTGGRPTWRCPACGDLTRHHKQRNKHGAIGLRRDGQGWACFQCEAKGDAVTLVAWRVLDRGQWSGPEDAARLRRECALRGLCNFAPGELAPPGAAPLRPLPSSHQAEAEAPKRPPAAEVTALWAACERLAAVPSWDGGPEWCGDVRRYLAEVREFDVGALAALDVARILPPPERYAFPKWWPAAWASTWRLVVPAYEPTGELASIHARAVFPDTEPKTRWPLGCGAGGLLLACPRGVAFLRGELLEPPPAVLVVEGLPDMLAEAQIQAEAGQHWPVLSVGSGSARAVGAVHWPRNVACLVATHEDKAGDRYEAEVAAALPAWVPFKRMPLERKRGKA